MTLRGFEVGSGGGFASHGHLETLIWCVLLWPQQPHRPSSRSPGWASSLFRNDRAHCPHFRPTCTIMQEGRMFVHIVYVLNVQILAPSNRIPDCTLYSVGVNSWTKSMVNVNVLFVQIFAPPRRRGEYLAIEHVYVNHALCPNIRPSWIPETWIAILSGNSEVSTRIHTSCMSLSCSGEAYICF